MIRTDRNQTFDSQGNLLTEEVVEVDITAEVVEWDLTDRIRQALVVNRQWLDRTGNPTNAQVLEHIDRLTRQVTALIKLNVRDLESPE